MLIAGNEIEGIGLGTAQFAFRDRTAEDSVATVHAALDAAVMLIDTALAYTRPGVESYAEQVVARAMRGLTTRRPPVATKGGHWRRGGKAPGVRQLRHAEQVAMYTRRPPDLPL